MAKANLAGSCKAMAILQDLSYHAIILQKNQRNSKTEQFHYKIIQLCPTPCWFCAPEGAFGNQKQEVHFIQKICLLVCFDYMKTTVKSNRRENVLSILKF